ncbi:hypothetical protein [Enterococcus gilvus]|uniref:hypothetical protein n=1 Tax=Enterococcus gilvus TaxID=160453 RepID=UPI003EDAE8A4
MYITFTYLDKPTKKAAKKLGKPGNKWSLLGKAEKKYTIAAASQHLAKLTDVLQNEGSQKGMLSIHLCDTEGQIEAPGTIYQFGPISYPVSEGLSLLEAIRTDLYAGTDENLSVEESYRNETILQLLEQELGQEDRSENEEAPWEQPIFSQEEVSSGETNHLEDELDDSIQKKAAAFREEEQEENRVQTETPTKKEALHPQKKERPREDDQARPLEEFEAYLSLSPEEHSLIQEQEVQLEKTINSEGLLKEFPAEETWLKVKIQAYVQSEAEQFQLAQIKEVFLQERQQAFSQARELLAEQYRLVQEDAIEARAQQQIASALQALNQQLDHSIETYKEGLAQKWAVRENELDKKQQDEIDLLVKEIKNKYARLKKTEQEEQGAKLAAFSAEQQEKTAEEKETLVAKEMRQIKKEHEETLSQVRTEVKKNIEDHLRTLFSNTSQVIREKKQQMLQEINEKIVYWKQEHAEQLEKAREAEEKARKDAIKQECLRIQKEAQSLRKRELELKEQELAANNRPQGQAGQPVVVVPAMTEKSGPETSQVLADLLKEFHEQKPPEMVSKKPSNRCLFLCLVSTSLLIGGGVVEAVHYFSTSVSQAETIRSVQSSESFRSAQSEATTTTQSASSGSTDSTTFKSIPSATEKQDPEQIRAFFFHANDKEQLARFNQEYPSGIGDLDLAILDNQPETAIAAYEKLSGTEKAQLEQTQKVAVKAFYTGKNQSKKAEEVS